MVALISLAVILVCLIPVYFSVKGKAKRPWFYLIVTSASYIIMAIISYVILKLALNSVESSAFFKLNVEIYILLIEAVVIIQLAVITLLDIVFMLCMGIANFVKNHKSIVISFLAGVLAALLAVSVIFTVSSIKNIDNNICTIMPPRIDYVKDGQCIESIEASLSGDFTIYLTGADETYFGKVDKSEYIHVSIRDAADMYIYPHGENSVILEYSPRGFGFTQRYVSSFQGFEYYMQEIYKQTGDEGFNIYPEE
jgi:hypothetical protein